MKGRQSRWQCIAMIVVNCSNSSNLVTTSLLTHSLQHIHYNIWFSQCVSILFTSKFQLYGAQEVVKARKCDWIFRPLVISSVEINCCTSVYKSLLEAAFARQSAWGCTKTILNDIFKKKVLSSEKKGDHKICKIGLLSWHGVVNDSLLCSMQYRAQHLSCQSFPIPCNFF